MKTDEMELILARYFNPRVNIIVPNVSWGMFFHECDLIVLSKAGYASEIEIKVSKADLIKDKQKGHGHSSEKISRLYFAIPTKLMPFIEHIPERAGIIEVRKDVYPLVIIRRTPQEHLYRFTEDEKLKLARLGTMRVWNLKQTLTDLVRQRQNDRKRFID